MTYFVVDMHAPGVEVRPLRQMTGDAEFNEVFFTDARIPDAERLGDGGRRLARRPHHAHERAGLHRRRRGARRRGPIDDALRIWKRAVAGDNRPTPGPCATGSCPAGSAARSTRLTNMRAAAARQAGTPGPEGSVAKLAYAELNQRIYELCVDLLGRRRHALRSDYPKMPAPTRGAWAPPTCQAFLRVRANSIEGGTSEVMRNILGERVLGLPG